MIARPAPIIMVHGAFCGGWTFDAFRQPFEAAGHAVINPDLPGHGPEESPAGLSMSDYAKAIADLAQAQDAPPVLVGHSMGGLVCQMAAERTQVAGLVLLAPSAPWGLAGQSVEEGISAVSLFSLGPFWLQAVAPDRTVTAHYSLSRLDPAERDQVFARMGRESGRALFEVLSWWMDPSMTTHVGAAGGVRSLTIGGGADAINPAATVRRTAERLGGDFRLFDSMSHWLPGEPGWEEVAETCVAWINAS
jgi:pimeloyl-ACP methyl ester carboxylesterase